MSIIVILGIGIFLTLLIGGLIWAVFQDSKENSKEEKNNLIKK